MAKDRIDPSEQIPEADLLEQQVPLDPGPLTDAESALEASGTLDDTADEADLMEQAAVLEGDEDDYPRESEDDRWS